MVIVSFFSVLFGSFVICHDILLEVCHTDIGHNHYESWESLVFVCFWNSFSLFR